MQCASGRLAVVLKLALFSNVVRCCCYVLHVRCFACYEWIPMDLQCCKRRFINCLLGICRKYGSTHYTDNAVRLIWLRLTVAHVFSVASPPENEESEQSVNLSITLNTNRMTSSYWTLIWNCSLRGSERKKITWIAIRFFMECVRVWFHFRCVFRTSARDPSTDRLSFSVSMNVYPYPLYLSAYSTVIGSVILCKTLSANVSLYDLQLAV